MPPGASLSLNSLGESVPECSGPATLDSLELDARFAVRRYARTRQPASTWAVVHECAANRSPASHRRSRVPGAGADTAAACMSARHQAARKTNQPFPKVIANTVHLVRMLNGLWGSTKAANEHSVHHMRGVSTAHAAPECPEEW